MIKAVIIEDEPMASDLLRNMLLQVDPEVDIKAVLPNVDESIQYLNRNETVDLIFCDVQLPDGLSFSIFNKVHTNTPIVFITGYDQFMLDAFESNGIDYLLKPVSAEDLSKALNKYKALQKHFSNGNDSSPIKQFLNYMSAHKRTRIVAKRGIENITLLLADIVLFYTENKVAYALDKNGRKYLIDKNLSDLELELDPQQFFRANRQYILNIEYIKSFKPYERVKLWVELLPNDIDHSIIISQETAPVFRKWLLNA